MYVVEGGIIKTVQEEHLKEVLTSIGEWEKFQSGNCQCELCRQTITVSNLGMICPVDHDETYYLCISEACLPMQGQGNYKGKEN